MTPQAEVPAFQAQVGVVCPNNGVLLHSEAVVNYPHVLGLVLHCEAKSQPNVDLYKGHAKGDKMLVQTPEVIHPNPLVIQVDPQVLHYTSVL